MIPIVLLGLFALSNVVIVAGYYNTLLGIDLLPITWVYAELPVVFGSLLLAGLAPLNVLISFFASGGSYSTYKYETVALPLPLRVTAT